VNQNSRSNPLYHHLGIFFVAEPCEDRDREAERETESERGREGEREREIEIDQESALPKSISKVH